MSEHKTPFGAIISHFDYKSKIKKVTRLDGGLIQESFLVEFTNSEPKILQKLNKIYSPESTYNIHYLTTFLREVKNIQTFMVLPTLDKVSLTLQFDGDLWRMLSYISGDTLSSITDTEKAFQAGATLGQFHVAIQGFGNFLKDHNLKLNERPGLHNTANHLSQLKSVSRSEQNMNLIEFRHKLVKATEANLLPTGLSKSFTHGDPKIQNIIFNNKHPYPCTLIDLDDINSQLNILYDLGDAFRSWCTVKTNFDDKDSFSTEIFKSAWKGYLSQAPDMISQIERKLLPQAIKLITLELGCRFLKDYYEDKYFAWDYKKYASRKEHNILRALRCWSLYLSICKEESKIVKIIGK